MSLTTLNTMTPDFIIQYNSSITDALRRAQALAATCESIFTGALTRFNIPDKSGFGTANPMTLIVDIPLDINGNPVYGGGNWGYATNKMGPITINPLSSTSQYWNYCALNGAADQPIADKLVQMFFVAELAEVLMAYRTQIIDKNKPTVWDPSSSDGEALSRVCAELFYPDVCYRYFSTPNITPWMKSDRSAHPNVNDWSKNNDWVSVNGYDNAPDGQDYGDGNGLAVGCAMLFIYYMTTQLGISLTTIIVNGGPTLQDTYTKLKSAGLNNPQLAQADASGYIALTKLINSFFPVGHTPSLPTDNPFPLLTGAGRSVSLTFTLSKSVQSGVAGAPRENPREVWVSAGGNCPPKRYFYQIINQTQTLQCTATVIGFGQPLFAWTVAGQPISMSGNNNYTIITTVLVDQPDEPGVPVSKPQSSVLLDFSPVQQQLSAVLSIENYFFPGHIVIPVQVSVTEAYATTDPLAPVSGVGIIDAEVVQYDAQFYQDQTACVGALLAKLHNYGNPHWINLLLTLPDPVHDGSLGVFILDQVLQELQVLAQRQPEMAKSVARALSARLGLTASRLLALSQVAGRATVAGDA